MVCPEICIVHKYSALDWVVETLQQRHDGALSTAGLPHKGNLLALQNKESKRPKEVKQVQHAAVLFRFPLLLQLLSLANFMSLARLLDRQRHTLKNFDTRSSRVGKVHIFQLQCVNPVNFQSIIYLSLV